jgi:hypothetical protein
MMSTTVPPEGATVGGGLVGAATAGVSPVDIWVKTGACVGAVAQAVSKSTANNTSVISRNFIFSPLYLFCLVN